MCLSLMSFNVDRQDWGKVLRYVLTTFSHLVSASNMPRFTGTFSVCNLCTIIFCQTLLISFAVSTPKIVGMRYCRLFDKKLNVFCSPQYHCNSSTFQIVVKSSKFLVLRAYVPLPKTFKNHSMVFKLFLWNLVHTCISVKFLCGNFVW